MVQSTGPAYEELDLDVMGAGQRVEPNSISAVVSVVTLITALASLTRGCGDSVESECGGPSGGC